ncbi:MAG: anion permease [Clostridiales bacterium]|jgi:di/tricarboxylate transporter|nr:anion permease [Clostridiales bacterium]
MGQQIIVFTVIAIAMLLFIDGRIRYDFVALLGLLVLVITGVIMPEEAFLGFSHPAVITVAAILVISSALVKTGAIDYLVILLNRGTQKKSVKLLSLMLVTAIISGFMNNVGALALIMPIAITVAKDSKLPPSLFLMPIAFASLLGGMMTEIGTPPNLIISIYRTEAGMEPFAFFDFAPVGIVMVIIGILYMTLIGWRLIPHRRTSKNEKLFDIDEYLSEVLVSSNCKMIGKTLRDFYTVYKLEINVIGIIRNGRKIIAPLANEQLIIGDILILKALPTELVELVEKTGMTLKGAKLDELGSGEEFTIKDLALVEVVLRGDSPLIGRNAVETQLRNRFNINLVAVSRKGTSSIRRLKSFRFRSGDILLIQVPESMLQDTFSKLRCLPLAERGVSIKNNKSKMKQYLALGIFITSISLTTFGVLPVQIVFTLSALLMVLFKIINAREFYDAIEWPTIIMLGAFLPVGGALQSSGSSDTIANFLVQVSMNFSPLYTIVVLMTLTMLLTNLINNAAAAVLMAPIALSLASFMGVSSDPLLMSVCVASSSAFLTPIGHQSNMLVMGPGGYQFRDYWKVGLPLSILVIIIGAPLIVLVWPF